MTAQVRNAATLAYVALVARLLGLKNTESESNSRRPAMSMHAFLCGYPSLASFLLERLAAAATQTAASHATTPHPHLHPVLLLFANMQRSDGEARQASVKSPGPAVTQLQNVLQQCLSMPSLAVRTLAARALAALCPAGGLPAALARHIQAVPDLPAKLQQQSADAVHGALLAAHHMLLNAMPPCSEDEMAAASTVAAPLLAQRLWMLRLSLCPCSAVSREFVHILEAYNNAQAASTHFTGSMVPPVNGAKVVAGDAWGALAGTGVPTGAAQALMQFQCPSHKPQMAMQDLWSQSMARLSFSDASVAPSVCSATAVHALRSQHDCLRIEGFKWLASGNVRHLGCDMKRNVADELWAAIDVESNQDALGAALEAAVCFGGELEMQAPQGRQQSDVSCDTSQGSSREDVLQLWLAACAAADKRLQQVKSAAAKHCNDPRISQQALQFTGVLLGELIEGCSHYGVELSVAFAEESISSRCDTLLVVPTCACTVSA